MPTPIVHVQIKLTQGNSAELRVFGAVASGYGLARSVMLDAIQDLVGKAETYYYTPEQEDFLKLGKRLYEWVDGDDRVLSRAIAEVKPGVIAIAAVEGLAHLPWEMLADGEGFLVGRGIVPVRWVSMGRDSIEWVNAPKSEEMKLMLMATDPAESTSLDYEAEEGRILEATGRSGLELVVEESGCLEELGLLVRDYGAGYFDAFHLTGHATSDGTEPKFGMESLTGELALVTAREIGTAFGGLPTLVFLSGCQTGKLGAKGAIASMSAQLVMAGAQAVLGWGETVADVEASLAAEILYGELAAGRSVVVALAETYRRLMTDARDYAVRDWHKLRLYVGDRLPGELVVPLRMRKKKKARVRLTETEFLDGAGLVKVASRSTFVGRRRILQRVLRVMQDDESVGVMLHGLGGNGKSSVAARVCDRLAMSSVRKYKRVVIFGAVDEAGFVNAFCRELVREPECVKLLSEPGDLRSRLVRVLELTSENWLFVMDDFEALSSDGRSLNLDERNGSYVMKPEVAAVMGAIGDALWECGGRLLVTSRYEVAGLDRVVRVPLGAMDDREMIKKRRQLEYVAKIAKAIEADKSAMRALQAQAETLADGNPRLLEWLDRVLCEVADPTDILAALEVKAIEFRADVLAEKLLALLGTKERQALARGLVFEIGVPRVVFESVVDFGDFTKATALGLLAVSPDGNVRVPRLLGLEVPQDETLAATAAQAIYDVWGKDAFTEIRAFEIHRLALTGKEQLIASEVGVALATILYRRSRYFEAEVVSRSTLTISDNYKVWHHLGLSLCYRDEHLSLEAYSTAIRKLPVGELDKETLEDKASIMHNIAYLYTRQDRLDEAVKLYEESFAIVEILQDQQGLAAISNQLGVLKQKQGKISDAISLHQKSLEIARKNNLQGDIASALHCIAAIYSHQDQNTDTLKLFEESLEIYLSIKDPQGIAATLTSLATVNYLNQGDANKAINLYKKALAIQKSIGDQRNIADTLCMLSLLITSHQQDFGTAIDYLQQSEAILRRIGSPDAETVAKILQRVEGMAK